MVEGTIADSGWKRSVKEGKIIRGRSWLFMLVAKRVDLI